MIDKIQLIKQRLNMDERDKKYPPPPSYYQDFASGSDAKSPPDLAKLSQKDYFILYSMKSKINLKGAVKTQSPVETHLTMVGSMSNKVNPQITETPRQ